MRYCQSNWGEAAKSGAWPPGISGWLRRNLKTSPRDHPAFGRSGPRPSGRQQQSRQKKCLPMIMRAHWRTKAAKAATSIIVFMCFYGFPWASLETRMVPGGGIEPPTRGFSIRCSTPELPGRAERGSGYLTKAAGLVYVQISGILHHLQRGVLRPLLRHLRMGARQ